MKHVFTRNNALASVEDIIEAKKEEDDLQTALKNVFTIGNKRASEEQKIKQQERINKLANTNRQKTIATKYKNIFNRSK